MDWVSDNDVEIIGELGWNLHALSLEYASTEVLAETITYHVLIDTIARFPTLQSLCLRAFKPRDLPVPLSGNGHPPIKGTFPSIRRLFVSGSRTIAGLDLISRCPNVNILDLSDITKEDILREYRFPTWPPLRSLRCSVRYMEEAYVNNVVNVGSALHLQVDDVLSVVDVIGGNGDVSGDGDEQEDDNENDIPVLLSMLQRVSLMWAQVALFVGGTPMRFWKDIPSLAPRLRYLELKILLKDMKEEYADWLENVPSAVSSLPLYYLKLYIQELRTSETLWSRSTSQFVRDSNGQYVHDTTKEGTLAFAFYAACVATAETLPERCACAIPTLKFFVLSDEGQLEGFERARRAAGGEPQECFILPIGQQEANGGADADKAIVDIEEACSDDDDDYDYGYMQAWRWPEKRPETMRSWRIARDANGEGVRLQRLKVAQGRRLQRCLGVCFDNKDPLDDFLMFYRDSDPGVS
ncbi:hypothetical protein C8Q80DRAFT_1311242 [Daedaleopsis nitida]|nr:hypothetical protein C8Q80DRAFT_1311242 [Daedaleopsis nitida]